MTASKGPHGRIKFRNQARELVVLDLMDLWTFGSLNSLLLPSFYKAIYWPHLRLGKKKTD